MFTAAAWEHDVPKNTADFPRVHKGKRSAKSSKVHFITSPAKDKVKNDKNSKINEHVNSKPNNVQDKKNKAEKRKHSSAITKLMTKSAEPKIGEPQKKKKKINKAALSDDLEQLDETIIANKKKEMFQAMKPNEVENMLFGNNSDGKKKNKSVLDNPLKRRKIENNSTSLHDGVTERNNRKKKNKQNPLTAGKVLHQRMTERNNNNKEKIKQKIKSILDNPFSRRMIGSTGTPLHQRVTERFEEKKVGEPFEKKQDMNRALSDDQEKLDEGKTHATLGSDLSRRRLNCSGKELHQKMMERLKGGRFRYLNEKLYLSEGKDAQEMFKKDPAAFKVYHDGFRQQVKKWPINPLDVIIQQIAKMPKETKVADMGCGEAKLAARVAQKVRSFDLVSAVDGVEECDMARTPLLTGEMDVAVYCLALMGTNLREYLIEANRILKIGGTMKIAEVESRFDDVNNFIKCVEGYGFKLGRADRTNDLFYFLDFRKLRDLGKKRGRLPEVTLAPCLYKKR